MKWDDWKLLQLEERREDEEPRVEVTTSEPDQTEAEPERDPERELVRI